MLTQFSLLYTNYVLLARRLVGDARKSLKIFQDHYFCLHFHKMSLLPKELDFDKSSAELKEVIKRVVSLDHVPKSIRGKGISDIYSICVTRWNNNLNDLKPELHYFLIEAITL